MADRFWIFSIILLIFLGIPNFSECHVTTKKSVKPDNGVQWSMVKNPSENSKNVSQTLNPTANENSSSILNEISNETFGPVSKSGKIGEPLGENKFLTNLISTLTTIVTSGKRKSIEPEDEPPCQPLPPYGVGPQLPWQTQGDIFGGAQVPYHPKPLPQAEYEAQILGTFFMPPPPPPHPIYTAPPPFHQHVVLPPQAQNIYAGPQMPYNPRPLSPAEYEAELQQHGTPGTFFLPPPPQPQQPIYTGLQPPHQHVMLPPPPQEIYAGAQVPYNPRPLFPPPPQYIYPKPQLPHQHAMFPSSPEDIFPETKVPYSPRPLSSADYEAELLDYGNPGTLFMPRPIYPGSQQPHQHVMLPPPQQKPNLPPPQSSTSTPQFSCDTLLEMVELCKKDVSAVEKKKNETLEYVTCKDLKDIYQRNCLNPVLKAIRLGSLKNFVLQ